MVMSVWEGVSTNNNARAAADEVTKSWPQQGFAANTVIIVFASTQQNPHEIAQYFYEKYPQCLVIGCTTSGEHLSGNHYNGSVVATAFTDPSIQWGVGLVQGLSSFSDEQAYQLGDQLFAKIGVKREDVDPQKYFGLMFIDGMMAKEETVTAHLADAIEGIPLIGGSAGDDLQFKETYVFYQGKAYRDAAIVVLAKAERPFYIFKHQHFTSSKIKLTITKADVAARRVYEINGYPAAQAYARALGVKREELKGDVTFLHPVVFSCNQKLYVRSIQQVFDDDSMTFYCAIEEGMVLEVGGHHDIEQSLQEEFNTLIQQYGGAQFFLGYNCILRALETTSLKKHDQLGESFRKVSQHSICFDTYGEQINGLHMNQTLVGIAFPA